MDCEERRVRSAAVAGVVRDRRAAGTGALFVAALGNRRAGGGGLPRGRGVRARSAQDREKAFGDDRAGDAHLHYRLRLARARGGRGGAVQGTDRRLDRAGAAGAAGAGRGHLLLAPFETKTQRRYWDEAQAILRRHNPMVIAITGSYGKTSVKHILGHVLETAAPTLITRAASTRRWASPRDPRAAAAASSLPGGRVGAYGPGSIRRLRALTPPKMGIVTAIGMAHYARLNRSKPWPRPSSSWRKRSPRKAARSSPPRIRCNSRRRADLPKLIRACWLRWGRRPARRSRSPGCGRRSTASSSR